MLNLYEQAGETQKGRETQNKFANDFVSRQIFHRYCSQQQHFLFSFLWFLFVFLFFSIACFFFVFYLCVCFLNKKYILVHIRLCGKVSNKKNFARPISENLAQFKICDFSFFHMQPPPTSKF